MASWKNSRSPKFTKFIIEHPKFKLIELYELIISITGWPFSGKSGKPGKVREFRKTWKKPGKVRESLRFFE